MKKKTKRVARKKDPAKMSPDEYAKWARDKTDDEIIEHFPGMVLPPRPPVGLSQQEIERKILDRLPEPPPDNASERSILQWLKEVGEVGGSPALMLVFSSNRYWPFSASARAQVWSAALRIQDEVMAREKVEAAKRVEELRERARKNLAGKTLKKWFNTRTDAGV